MRITLAAAAALLATAGASADIAHPLVELQTTEGRIVLELDTRRAPLTVANFLALARAGKLDGTMFHRVVRDFVIQAGGYDAKYEVREDDTATVANESGNGLSNRRGTIAMARTEDPHSAASQFYINLADNGQLDPRPDRWGYAVFGKVVEGMDVVDGIGNLPTGPGGPFDRSVPALPVIIEKVTVVGD